MPLRVALAIGLFFLSPLVGEYLLGNIAIDAIPPLLFLGPMYGGGAVLVREAARHSGRGWPTVILLIVAAFSVSELRPRKDPEAPGPWKVGGFSLAAASAFLGLRYVLGGWPIVAAYLIVYGCVAVVVVRWSGRSGWSPVHNVAL